MCGCAFDGQRAVGGPVASAALVPLVAVLLVGTAAGASPPSGGGHGFLSQGAAHKAVAAAALATLPAGFQESTVFSGFRRTGEG